MVADVRTMVMDILLLLIQQPLKKTFSFPLSPAQLIGNVLPNRQCAANMSRPLITHHYICAAQSKYWCCMSTFLFIFVQVVIFHQYIKMLQKTHSNKQCCGTGTGTVGTVTF
jgi:hypothetical protein